jgi:hypothetical protein
VLTSGQRRSVISVRKLKRAGKDRLGIALRIKGYGWKNERKTNQE